MLEVCTAFSVKRGTCLSEPHPHIRASSVLPEPLNSGNCPGHQPLSTGQPPSSSSLGTAGSFTALPGNQPCGLSQAAQPGRWGHPAQITCAVHTLCAIKLQRSPRQAGSGSGTPDPPSHRWSSHRCFFCQRSLGATGQGRPPSFPPCPFPTCPPGMAGVNGEERVTSSHLLVSQDPRPRPRWGGVEKPPPPPHL